MSAPARWELWKATHAHYRSAPRASKGQILDEFCRATGYHRKYALRLLNGAPPGVARPRRRRRPVTYSAAMIQALRVIWEAAGYPWSVRLKALLPAWLPWARRRLGLSPAVCRQLRAISARQMDRRLAPLKRQLRARRYGRTKPGSLLKHHIPLKTDHWAVTVPGFAEVDLVAPAGSRAEGEFAHSLNVTDMHTTWVETRAVLGRSEVGVQEALEDIRQALPFRLQGIDSDNGSEFINDHLYRYCQAQAIQFTGAGPTRRTTTLTSSRRTGPMSESSWATIATTPRARSPRSTTCTATSCVSSKICSCPRSSSSARSASGRASAAATMLRARPSSAARPAPPPTAPTWPSSSLSAIAWTPLPWPPPSITNSIACSALPRHPAPRPRGRPRRDGPSAAVPRGTITLRTSPLPTICAGPRGVLLG
jgi:hypothetical protein